MQAVCMDEVNDLIKLHLEMESIKNTASLIINVCFANKHIKNDSNGFAIIFYWEANKSISPITVFPTSR